MQLIEPTSSFPSPQKIKQFILKWTPRAIAAGIGGYYALGIAYHFGLMAAIDKIAIAIIREFAGYAGVGALMPTFQWYAAWGVRILAASGAGFLYDRIERVALCCYNKFFPHPALSS